MTAPLKADVTAAERLLKAAVRRAVETLRQPYPMHGADPLLRHFGVKATAHRPASAADVVDMLANAATAAELLLSERTS